MPISGRMFLCWARHSRLSASPRSSLDRSSDRPSSCRSRITRGIDHVPQIRDRRHDTHLDRPLDEGRVGFWTSSKSGNYKRLRNNATITLQPSDSCGRVKQGAPPVEGTAKLATSGPDFDAIQAKVRAKYGFMVTMSHFFNTLGHLGKGPFPHGDVGVVVTLTDQS